MYIDNKGDSKGLRSKIIRLEYIHSLIFTIKYEKETNIRWYQQNNQYYSSSPGQASHTQYSSGQSHPGQPQHQAQQYQTSHSYSNQLISPNSSQQTSQLMSPNSQTSPLNLTSKSYISPQGTVSQNGQQPQYYNSQ